MALNPWKNQTILLNYNIFTICVFFFIYYLAINKSSCLGLTRLKHNSLGFTRVLTSSINNKIVRNATWAFGPMVIPFPKKSYPSMRMWV